MVLGWGQPQVEVWREGSAGAAVAEKEMRLRGWLGVGFCRLGREEKRNGLDLG